MDIPNYITVVRLEQNTEDDFHFVAFHPELPTVLSQGDTPEEARENLVEATEMAISHLVANSLPVPPARTIKPDTHFDEEKDNLSPSRTAASEQRPIIINRSIPTGRFEDISA